MSGNAGKKIRDCPSNLKEAIDWILRVTGKDGQGDRDNTAALAKAVKDLIEGVFGEIDGLRSKYRVNGPELDKLKEGLQKAKEWVGQDVDDDDIYTSGTKGPIGRLAEGLRVFIGYGRRGIIGTGLYEGKITGGGIAPSNIATHRLCDAAIAFTIGVLEGCKNNNEINTEQDYISRINSVISKLYGIYGGGPAKLQDVAGDVKSDLSNVNASMVGSLVKTMGTLFNSLGNDFKTENDNAEKVAEQVGEYVYNAINSSGSGRTGGSLTTGGGPMSTALKNFVSKETYDPIQLKSNITSLTKLLTPKGSYAVKSALAAGTGAFITHLKAKYESAYQATTANWIPDDAPKCAKIFLGCVPLFFNGLSYLYWGCDPQAKGPWSSEKLGGVSLKDFMLTMSYGSTFLNGSKRGTDVTGTTLKKFADLKDGMQKAQQVAQARTSEVSSASSTSLAAAPVKVSYSEFLSALKQTWTESSADTALSFLYYCASCYFKCIQVKNAEQAETSPSTIRQMLYFLAALPFSPEIDGYENYIDTLLSNPIPVTMAGSSLYYKFTAANVNSTLTTSVCLSATTMLGRFQGPGFSAQGDDPFLHNLYCNGIGIKYPNGAALFHKLTDCVYSIQFQMNFLLQQCSGRYTDARRWRDCRFGKEIEPKEAYADLVSSHICAGYACSITNALQCQHNGSGPTSNGCTHNASNGAKCGSGSTDLSPLQAFLTDNLKGFSQSDKAHQSSSNHLKNHPAGPMCHVKMGFQPNDLRDSAASKGAHIAATLQYICANAISPFRQFCENLLCLSKRTPRTLGDFFGFYWHMVTVTGSGSLITDTMAYISETFLQNHEKVKFIKALSELNGSKQTHVSLLWNHSAQADLMSLYYPECSGENCGPYLLPLVYSAGATFSPNYAYTYLSWLVYLADDFRDWLNELLERFNDLMCTSCGHNCGSPGHSKDHGSGQACQCPSITQCADVLPLFYGYGFTMLDPGRLNGWKNDRGTLKPNPSVKRTCAHFHTQLNAVINGALFSTALSVIDGFLYLFRMYFFYNVSAFWTVYLGIIVYFIFYGIDVLHLKSHLHFPSSHGLLPITLLTTGKSPSVTKLAYFTTDLT